jgi:hypothetical protein
MFSGRNGENPVAYVCPAPGGSTLTFEWRLWPNYEQPGSIDPGHLGPCAVYIKRVDDMFSDDASGPGWFKIWEDGYDAASGKWCVDRLVEEKGLMSVDLPTGLPAGYYLVRPEILALHQAYRGDPQFYLGCAQIYVEGTAPALDVPEECRTSIPGHVEMDTPGLTFDIYKNPMPEYPMPGPKVFIPTFPSSSSSSLSSSTSSTSSKKTQQRQGTIPSSCLVKNANWCAMPIAAYDGENACWDGVKSCYAQSKECWDSAPASGSANCYTWSDYCQRMNDACEAGNFQGPPSFNGEEKFAEVPGEIPPMWNDVFEETDVGGQGAEKGDEKKKKEEEEPEDGEEKDDKKDNDGEGEHKPEPTRTAGEGKEEEVVVVTVTVTATAAATC